MNFLLSYQPLLDIFLLSLGFAYSQQIVLRAGVFSVATAGFASIGAYCAAILVKYHAVPAPIALGLALAFGALTGLLVSVPLSRLRGVYQAIATLAFVQIVVAITLTAEDLTGGGFGCIQRSGIGRAFDAIQQDELVGAVLGVSIRKYHALAFTMSGAIGSFFGGVESLHSYSLIPGQYGFPFVVAVLAYNVVGGRRAVVGPVIGVAFLSLLPELSRPFAEYRPMITGAIMIAVMNFMPHGLADTVISWWRRRGTQRRFLSQEGHRANVAA